MPRGPRGPSLLRALAAGRPSDVACGPKAFFHTPPAHPESPPQHVTGQVLWSGTGEVTRVPRRRVQPGTAKMGWKACMWSCSECIAVALTNQEQLLLQATALTRCFAAQAASQRKSQNCRVQASKEPVIWVEGRAYGRPTTCSMES